MKITFITALILIFISLLNAQDKRNVVLVPFGNKGGADVDWVSGGLEYLLYNKMSVISGFYAFEKDIILNALKNVEYNNGELSERAAGQLGRALSADVTVSGVYSGSSTRFTFTVYYHNASSGDQIYSEQISAGGSELGTIADKIIDQLVTISGITLSSTEKSLISRTLTKNPKAFESFIRAYIENSKPNSRAEMVINLFRQAINQDKNFWEAYYNLGISYFNDGQFSQALNQFNIIINALPNFDKPYYGRGLIFEEQKRYDQAIADFKKVTEFNPNDYKPYYYLGHINILKKDFKAAKENLDKAFGINPDFAPVHFEYGELEVAQGQVRSAIQHYRRAVELNPNNKKYRQTLGETYYRSQIFYNALIEFNTILQDYPADPLANFMKGVTIYKQAVLEELVEAFLDLLSEDNNRTAVKEKGFDKTQGVDPVKKRRVYEDMADAFTRATKARPNFMQATFNLALTYMEMGDMTNAERFFKNTLLISPDLIRAHMKLAEVYEKTDRLQQAIEQYKKVFYIEPGIFVSQPTLGPVFQYKNILNEFMADLDEKIKRNPNDPNNNIILAKVFKAQGYNGKAANILRSILNRNPGNNEAKRLLANIEKAQS